MADLPECGLYVTRAPVAGVPAGRLVYFHNHGDPGPGVYLPSRWSGNRALFENPGFTIAGPQDAAHLDALPMQGFFRVHKAFHCCDKQCQRFEEELLVQLGYDASGNALVFVPEIQEGHLGVPDRGTKVDRATLTNLVRLKVPSGRAPVDRTMH